MSLVTPSYWTVGQKIGTLLLHCFGHYMGGRYGVDISLGRGGRRPNRFFLFFYFTLLPELESRTEKEFFEKILPIS